MCYILLNHDTQSFVAKAEDYLTLCNLMEKVCPDEKISIQPTNSWHKSLKNEELKNFYQHHYGKPWIGETFDRASLVNILSLAVESLPLEKAIATAAIPQENSDGKEIPVGRPSPATKTGQVWVIADFLFTQLTSTKEKKFISDWKGFRLRLIKSCEDAGINSATASTQYSKWRNDLNSR